jgi:transcriptional regulator with XRE-family HTH domain
MEDARVGHAIRLVRRRRGWTQRTLAARVGASQGLISMIERGHMDTVSLRILRRVAGALDIRVDLTPRWRAGDLDRLLNARHSELHELVARWFAEELPDWVLAPEVSFSIYGERGVIDILAWHEKTGSLLVIELKTAIADVNELLGTMDRKKRLAAQVAGERGWHAKSVSTWLIVADTRTNRRRLDAHMAVIRNAMPDGTWAMRRWLRRPRETIAAVTVWAAMARYSTVDAVR